MTSRSLALVAFLCAVVFTTGCQAPHKVSWHGQLIAISAAGSIWRIDFPSMGAHRLYDEPGNGRFKYSEQSELFTHVAVVSPDRMIADVAIWDGKKMHWKLAELNPATHGMRYLFSGRMPVYIPRHDEVAFWTRDEAGWATLGILHLANDSVTMPGARSAAYRKRTRGFDAIAPVVQMGENRIAFMGSYGTLWIYDIDDGSIKKTPIHSCVPVAWRTATGQLLCRERTAERYFLTDLTSPKPQPLPALDGAISVLYVSKHDGVLYPKEWGSLLPPRDNVLSLFAYDFRRNSSTELLRNFSEAPHYGTYLEPQVWLDRPAPP